MLLAWLTSFPTTCPDTRHKVQTDWTRRGCCYVRNVNVRDKGAFLLTCRYKKDLRPRTVRRPSRIGSLLKRELADILQKYSLQENRQLDEQPFGLISVVRVDVSPDLRNAKAFISVTGSDTQKTTAYQWLHEERKSIKFELSQRIREIRYIPDIRFEESELGETMKTLNILDRLSADPNFTGTQNAFWEEDQGTHWE